jgi:hypothetical protein
MRNAPHLNAGNGLDDGGLAMGDVPNGACRSVSRDANAHARTRAHRHPVVSPSVSLSFFSTGACAPILMVACRLMTSGDSGLSCVTSSFPRSCTRSCLDPAPPLAPPPPATSAMLKTEQSVCCPVPFCTRRRARARVRAAAAAANGLFLAVLEPKQACDQREWRCRQRQRQRRRRRHQRCRVVHQPATAGTLRGDAGDGHVRTH